MMFSNDALAIIGIYILGAASGALLEYGRYRDLVALCKQLITETSSLDAGDGMLTAGHYGQSPAQEGSASRITRAEVPVSSGAIFSNNDPADFQLLTKLVRKSSNSDARQ